jgi:glycosyltransferase involved in cell wall biosynthesis
LGDSSQNNSGVGWADMKKIVYVASTLKACAPTSQLRYLLQGLDRQRFEPCVLTLSPEPRDTAAAAFVKLGLEIHSLALSRPSGALFGAQRMHQTLTSLKPDLVHSSGFRPDLLSATFGTTCPVVTTIRNYPFHDYPMKFGNLLGTWMAWRHRTILPRFHAVVPCSHAIARLFGDPPGRFYVIQDGVDTKYFHPAARDQRMRIRQEWGIGPDEVVFVSAGSLIRRKDPVTLLRGFLSSAVLPMSHLIILGEGPLHAECLRMAEGQPRISMPGQVSDVRRFLQGSDFFVSASRSEGLPNAVLEAMASGLPVALSDIPSHREQLQDAPLVGEFFPVGDATELGKCLERLMTSRKNDRAASAVVLVERSFSARQMSLAYQSLYSKLLDGKDAA